MKNLSVFWLKNGANISTIVACVGVATTTALASKASIKANADILEWKEENDVEKISKEHLVDLVKLNWKTYIPTAVSFAATIASIIAIRHAGAQQAAMYANMVSAAQTTLETYSKKVVERIGEEEEREIRKDVAQEQVDDNPPPSTMIISDDEVLFMDSYSGRYFKDSVENVRSYVNDINKQVLDEMFASLDDLYEYYGLEPTADSHAIGWNADNLMEVDFVPAEAPGKRPCFRIDYRPSPSIGYDRFM